MSKEPLAEKEEHIQDEESAEEETIVQKPKLMHVAEKPQDMYCKARSHITQKRIKTHQNSFAE